MDIIIQNTSGKPIYEQITAQIKNQILSGALQAGDEELERDGFIETVTGKGSFVAAQNAELLREEALRRTEQALRGAVDTARQGGVTDSEVREMLELVLEGE